MGKFLLGLIALFITSTTFADDYVIGLHGERYETGFLGPKLGGVKAQRWTPTKAEVDALPDSFDARDLGVVAPIRNQGSCGSCWAFSMVKTFESARLSVAKPYLDLAEQDILVNDKNAYGCGGGFMDGSYIVKHGLALESDCPYKGSDRVRCKKPAADKSPKWGFVGAEGKAPSVEDLRAAIVKFHVISVTVAAGGKDWQGGNGGVMTGCRMGGTNHMVNLVGYDCKEGKPCSFIGANSWGTNWGDKGFFYAAQGCNELASEVDGALFIEASL